jgi:hypothetical protein
LRTEPADERAALEIGSTIGRRDPAASDPGGQPCTGSHPADGCWASWSTVRSLACKCAGGERFCGAEIASVAGMGATGDLQPDPVPAPERVDDRPQIKLDGLRGVWCGIGEAHDSVRDIDRPAARVDVAEADMQVDVRHRCLHVQA